ncbi:hypothetical protein K1T71_013250 [Dendrolimus kikuchii]|uniref:Uncharacterized protein n=1 Tax=Dendrolimus kikuchii TaxID=765133 RepID=A0ACC1CHT9_9NEOP|nr:hypothetical protein K1T71_013250 [Dendrolimus kikuchii]
MYNFTYLFLSLSILSAAPNTRIVGGEHTTIERFPYITALTYHYPGAGITIQRCVGALLSSWHVLTTGFCFTGAILTNFEVRAGSTNSLWGGVVVTIGDMVKHPEYVEAPRAGDIAVVILQSPLGISSTVNILFLPPQNTYIPDGESVKIVSWGFEYLGGPQLETLKTINMNKLSLDECAEKYEGNTGVAIVDEVICAGAAGRATCFGDSGAPMVINQVLVGSASYYDSCSDEYPSVFTRVDRYTNWILEVASRAGKSGPMVKTSPLDL